MVVECTVGANGGVENALYTTQYAAIEPGSDLESAQASSRNLLLRLCDSRYSLGDSRRTVANSVARPSSAQITVSLIE